MSITGSLLGCENKKRALNRTKQRHSLLHNNNENNNGKSSSMGKMSPPSLNSSISNSVITNASSNLGHHYNHNHNHSHSHSQHPGYQQQLQQQQQQSHLQAKYMNSKRKHSKYNNMYPTVYTDHNNYLHLNSLWSIWYGVLLTLFQGYLAVHGAYRFLGCSLISWKIEPVAELNLQIVLSGVVFVLLPFFFTSAVFKVGNLANDGIKLATGAKERRCSMSPHDGLEEEARGGTVRALWTHGGPTAAFVHIAIAMCLLLPRLLLEARIIENGLLPRESIWQTELDFMTVSRRNLVVLSVVTSPYQNNSRFESREEEDYYNDTLFSGTVSGSAVGNNLLDKEATSKYHKDLGGKSATGKTSFYEVPDLNGGAGLGDRKKVTSKSYGEESIRTAQGMLQDGDKLKITEPTTTTTMMMTMMTTMTTMTEKSTDTENDVKMGESGNSASGADDATTSTATTRTTTGPTAPAPATATATTSSTETPTRPHIQTTLPGTTNPVTRDAGEDDLSGSGSGSGSRLAFTTISSTSSGLSTTLTSATSPSFRSHASNRHHSHTGKAARKHGPHRQRRPAGQRIPHHQQTLAAGGRSHDLHRLMRLEEVAQRPIDQNRLDDFDFTSGGGAIFEHSAGGVNTLRPGSREGGATSHEELDYGRARAIFPKSTSTMSTTTRDSNIHIVKPERLPEIIPSTPVASNSKIIEIKTKSAKRIKRTTALGEEEMHVEIEPDYLVGDLSLNDSSEYVAEQHTPPSDAPSSVSAGDRPADTGSSNEAVVRLDGFAGMLQLFFGIEKPIDVAAFSQPPSAEFVNLLFALLVWCVRYPAVFWTTAKSFATIFSVQMIAAAADIIFSFVGISNLYKLQIYSEAQPVQHPGLILNAPVTLSLFLLSALLMIASSMIVYLYGHGRLAAKMRDRSLITLKSSETWIYFAHCASLCYVLALAVVKAPLLNDLSATYRHNLHCPTFLAALVSVMHLLLWIVIWLGLTAKRRWSFKLPPMDAYGMVGKATTQPLLMHSRGSISNTTAVTLTGSSAISGGGGGGGVGGGGGGGEGGPTNDLDQKLSTSTASCHHIHNTSSSDTANGAPAEDIYWPKLMASSPKLKVTFNEVTSTSDDDVLLIGDHDQTDGKRNSARGTAVCFASAAGEIDDGEYATLRSATAASVVGMAVGGGGGGTGTGTCTGVGINKGPTSAAGVKVLRLSEYDELPPPPAHMMSSVTLTNAAAVSVNTAGDYVNCVGNGVGDSSGGGGGSGSGGISSDDNISEEGKLLACVRDDSVTYASASDLEPPATQLQLPPLPPPPPSSPSSSSFCLAKAMPDLVKSPTNVKCVAAVGRAPQAVPEVMQLSPSSEHQDLVSPLAPVTVTVHTNEAHIASSSTPRCLRRADSGVPQEALTPRSDTTSTGTESTTSPPERAPSESSSGVHSGEERDVEVVIRPRVACKPPAKPPPPAIQEEPYGRCTNMRMSSFASGGGSNATSATLPLQRSGASEQRYDYTQHCSTMPLPAGCHSQQQQQQQQGQQQQFAVYATSVHGMLPHSGSNVSSFKSQMYANSAVAMAGYNAQHQQPPLPPPPHLTHTTLPNGVRYSNPHFLRRLAHVSKAAESPYGHLGLGAGHHAFSKLAYDPLQTNLATTSIPEDRDSANYSMSSDQDCLYATANNLH